MTDQDPDQGNFLTGFTLGIFAGAAGFFLFGTQKGSDLRDQLTAEWEAAKADLVQEGVIDQNQSLRDIIAGVFTKIGLNIQATQKSPEKHLTKTNREKKTSTKFKGI